MEIQYSPPLQFKLRVRGIANDLPAQIYRESKQRLYNHHSIRCVAVMETLHLKRRTLMMIASDQFPDRVEIVTILPITKSQIQDRLRDGRWSYE